MLHFHENLERHGSSGRWTKEEAAYLLLQLHSFYEYRGDVPPYTFEIAAQALNVALAAAEYAENSGVIFDLLEPIGYLMGECHTLALNLDPKHESLAHLVPRFEFGLRLFQRSTKIETPQEDVFVVSESGYRGNLQIVRT